MPILVLRLFGSGVTCLTVFHYDIRRYIPRWRWTFGDTLIRSVALGYLACDSSHFLTGYSNGKPCLIVYHKSLASSTAYPLESKPSPRRPNVMARDQRFVMRFGGPKPDTLASFPTRISIVEIIRHEPYGASAGVLQCVWEISRVRHVVVPQVEPNDPIPRVISVSRSRHFARQDLQIPVVFVARVLTSPLAPHFLHQ